MILSKGDRLQVEKSNKTFIGTIKAVFQDYYLVIDRNGKANYAFEGEYTLI